MRDELGIAADMAAVGASKLTLAAPPIARGESVVSASLSRVQLPFSRSSIKPLRVRRVTRNHAFVSRTRVFASSAIEDQKEQPLSEEATPQQVRKLTNSQSTSRV